MKEFRILALDGGGSWALIQVRALSEIYRRVFGKPPEQIKGHDVLRRFDLVAANSGGTLTLAGLLKNWSLAELRGLFEDDALRRKIFAPADIFHRPLEHLLRIVGIGPKYSTTRKFAGLKSILDADGARNLVDLPAFVGPNYSGRLPQFLFCALNYDTERASFMRSHANSLAASSVPQSGTTLVDAVHASANPPVNLFDEPAERSDKTRCWDGAMAGHNNPVMAAVIEALANRGAYQTERSMIRALSLGTGNTMLPVKKGSVTPDEAPYYVKAARPWILADVRKLALSIMGDPPDAATFHAHMLLDGQLPAHEQTAAVHSPIVRMNPLIQPVRGADGSWTAPPGYDASSFLRLRKIDMDAITPADISDINLFCDRWMDDSVPNQPIRTNSRDFRPEIGFGRYSEALASAIQTFS